MRIFTWHIHGTYLYYLSQGPFEIFIPVNDQRTEGYYGRGETFPFADNVVEVPAAEVRNLDFDCILFQTNKNFLTDQYEILSEAQQKLPRVYVEHDPPAGHPTDSRHIMNDPEVVMVHVTHYNRLMWHNSVPFVKVIEHGVPEARVPYTGELERGIVVVNHLHQRGRKLGADIFEKVKKEVPLDLVGMGTEEYGGLGEVLHPQLGAFISRYRFFFNPIRYTSLGLSFCEAMMGGVPVVALATTEYASVVSDRVSGYIHTDIDYLVEKMKALLNDPGMARAIGHRGQMVAQQRFDIHRFTQEWQEVFLFAKNKSRHYEKESSAYQ